MSIPVHSVETSLSTYESIHGTHNVYDFILLHSVTRFKSSQVKWPSMRRHQCQWHQCYTYLRNSLRYNRRIRSRA